MTINKNGRFNRNIIIIKKSGSVLKLGNKLCTECPNATKKIAPPLRISKKTFLAITQNFSNSNLAFYMLQEKQGITLTHQVKRNRRLRQEYHIVKTINRLSVLKPKQI